MIIGAGVTVGIGVTAGMGVGIGIGVGIDCATPTVDAAAVSATLAMRVATILFMMTEVYRAAQAGKPACPESENG